MAASLVGRLCALPPTPGGLYDALAGVAAALLLSPIALVLAAGVVLGLAQFRRAQGGGPALGALHGVLHLALIAALLWLGAAFGHRALGLGPEAPALLVVVGLVLLVGGAVLGGLLFAGYLFLSSMLGGRHTEMLFAARRGQDHKAFVRMHVSPAGRLTLYAVGLDQVPRAWRVDPKGDPRGPWLVPQRGRLAPHLVDGPVDVD